MEAETIDDHRVPIQRSTHQFESKYWSGSNQHGRIKILNLYATGTLRSKMVVS